jgi:hypothetical protein
LLACGGGLVRAPAPFRAGSEAAEVRVGLQLATEILSNQLDQDGIVQVAQAGDSIGDHILGLHEVCKGVNDPGTIRAGELPLRIFQHLNHRLKLDKAFMDELRHFGVIQPG